MMKSEIEIINIDESSIQMLNVAKKGWKLKGKKRYSSNLTRINQVNIIAGVSNNGTVYFTLNQGKNNSLSVYNFILNFIEDLEINKPNWRNETVIMLDNAAYHRSKFFIEKLKNLEIPYAFLGPYQFELAPVEKLFAYLKQSKLDEYKYSKPQKYIFSLQFHSNLFRIEELMRFLANQFKKLDFKWVQDSFYSSLKSSLQHLYNPQI